jgi:hypothetical protein
MAAAFHDGCWCFKFLFVAGVFTGSMWIPKSFIEGYMELTRVASTGFLIYQAMLMLISAYKINEKLVENYANDKTRCSAWILVIVTLSITGLNLWWIIDQYMTFHNCSGNNWNMTVTLFIILFMYIIIIFRTREDASILTSGIASSYCLYL